MTAKELAIFCAKCADEHKATDIQILDMKRMWSISDYILLCSGDSERQLQGLAYDIEFKLKQEQTRCRAIEGYNVGKWIVLDFVDVVIHLYLREMRDYYEMDGLWADAHRVRWDKEE